MPHRWMGAVAGVVLMALTGPALAQSGGGGPSLSDTTLRLNLRSHFGMTEDRPSAENHADCAVAAMIQLTEAERRAIAAGPAADYLARTDALRPGSSAAVEACHQAYLDRVALDLGLAVRIDAAAAASGAFAGAGAAAYYAGCAIVALADLPADQKQAIIAAGTGDIIGRLAAAASPAMAADLDDCYGRFVAVTSPEAVAALTVVGERVAAAWATCESGGALLFPAAAQSAVLAAATPRARLDAIVIGIARNPAAAGVVQECRAGAPSDRPPPADDSPFAAAVQATLTAYYGCTAAFVLALPVSVKEALLTTDDLLYLRAIVDQARDPVAAAARLACRAERGFAP